VPVVSKVTGVPIARIATQIMMGKKLSDFPGIRDMKITFTGVKEAVFPFNMFPEVDPLLGPEMRATGEVMGAAESFELAFYKAQQATGAALPVKGNVLLTVADKDKSSILSLAKRVKDLGFNIFATKGTSRFLSENKIENTEIKKLHEGRPNISDAIKNDELQLIINTPVGKDSKYDDSYIRMMAIQRKTPYVTSVAAAEASVAGIEAVRGNAGMLPKALQEYYTG
jgi:carbamoyl-phosphate synthase large subunit